MKRELEQEDDGYEGSESYQRGYHWALTSATAAQLMRFPAFYRQVTFNLLGGDLVEESQLVDCIRDFLPSCSSKSAAYQWIEENLISRGCDTDEYDCISAADVDSFITGVMAGRCQVVGDFATAAKRRRQPA